MRTTMLATMLACAGLAQACAANASNAEVTSAKTVVASASESDTDCCEASSGTSVTVSSADGEIVAICEADSPSTFTVGDKGHVIVKKLDDGADSHRVIIKSLDGEKELKTKSKAFKIIVKKDGKTEVIDLKPGDSKAHAKAFTLKGDGKNSWTAKGGEGGAWTFEKSDGEVFELKNLPKGSFKFKEGAKPKALYFGDHDDDNVVFSSPKGTFEFKAAPKGSVKFFGHEGDNEYVVVAPEDGDWKRFVPKDAQKWIEKDAIVELHGEHDGQNFVFRGDGGAGASEDKPRLGVMLEEGDGYLSVNGVLDGMPAKKAGVKSGDVILAINGAKPATMDKLRKALGASEIGLTLKRDGDVLKLAVDLGAHEAHEEQEIRVERRGNSPKWRVRGVPAPEKLHEEVILRKRGGGNECNCECRNQSGPGALQFPALRSMDAEARERIEKSLGAARVELRLKRDDLDKLRSELHNELKGLDIDKKIMIELHEGLDHARKALHEADLDFDFDFDFEFDEESMHEAQKAIHDALQNIEIDIDVDEIHESIEQAMKHYKDGTGNVFIRRAPGSGEARVRVERDLARVKRHQAELEKRHAHAQEQRFSEMKRRQVEVEKRHAEAQERRQGNEWRAREKAAQGRNRAEDARLKELEARMERLEALLKKLSRDG